MPGRVKSSDPVAVEFARRGGRAHSEKKTAANRAKAAAYWADVKAGLREHHGRGPGKKTKAKADKST